MSERAAKWLKFLRQYGPIARNDNMYDETIQRSARRTGLQPVTFAHPSQDDILDNFSGNQRQCSVILTGTAGDGKSHLCRNVWMAIGGDMSQWATDASYLTHTVPIGTHGAFKTVHFIRDLSAWVPQRNANWTPDKRLLLESFGRSVFTDETEDTFLIAANDGQLVETWRRLPDAPFVSQVRELLEFLLVSKRTQSEGSRLKLFNLSQHSSADLLEQALDALLSHEEWQECLLSGDNGWAPFGIASPIRRNYELLNTKLIQHRLRCLFELCDYNGLHIPIRQILLLLANAILGHPQVPDKLMTPMDALRVITDGTVAKASIYNNIFGGNLSEARRDSITVFDYLSRFRIGYETSNRVDNILIFGEADQILRPYYDEFIASDPFYGADELYRAAQRDYVEGLIEDDDGRRNSFLEHLSGQRRGLFFKIPEGREDELHLWELTVFQFAGEYLSKVVSVLKAANRVERPILARMVRGLNRVFIGMLVTSERDLLLATSLSFSHAKVSRLLEESISVAPRLGEKVEIILDNNLPTLRVTLSAKNHCSLQLSLTRYEFLSRVAEGALPGSFSKECYEDLLAFKSQILSELSKRRQEDGEAEAPSLVFRLLHLDDNGNPTEEVVEVSRAD